MAFLYFFPLPQWPLKCKYAGKLLYQTIQGSKYKAQGKTLYNHAKFLSQSIVSHWHKIFASTDPLMKNKTFYIKFWT